MHCFIMRSAGDSGKLFNKRIRDRICELTVKLEQAADAGDFKDAVTEF